MNSDKKKNFVNVNTLTNASPLEVRLKIRSKELPDGQPTTGMCAGFTQANLAIVHQSLADDFEKFCHANSGPLPLLYQSKPGEFTAPGITHSDSDIRTDVSMYRVVENGKFTKSVGSLMDYKKEMEEMCTFYVGCSYSFEKALMNAGVPLRNVEESVTVGVFDSNIRCYPVGSFNCKQVLSMRPIPKNLIETAFQVTHVMKEVHGAPAHIGDPAMIGIDDHRKPDWGNDVTFNEDEVPVFWSCGVTTANAIASAGSPLAFTHFAGCMYISDSPATLNVKIDDNDKPRVITIRENPFFASAVGESVLNKVQQLESAMNEDPGNRGISSLIVKGDLIKSALNISHASSVAITTGFPCLTNKPVPYENDGLSGTFAMATMLQAMGKQVTIVVDTEMEKLMNDIVADLVSKGILSQQIDVLSFPPPGQEASLENAKLFLNEVDDLHPKYGHLIAIERAGRTSKKAWKTMKNVDITSLVSNIDLLFDASKDMTYLSTTGIGDGGNELGMGKVQEQVMKYIPQGKEISCEVAADYVLTAGVSDWGGYALCMALYAVGLCPIHDRYVRQNIGYPRYSKEKLQAALPTVERQEAMLRTLMDHEIGDGIFPELSMSIDGLPFHPVHEKKIKQLWKDFT
ncbi:D-glutamate cyclase, mitochondrial-like [Saccoglossus kowalevskii]|uniref:UPF0317 protein C14orf159 homolog, mitochondrial-like n=1 Tax=Saccoglossus kowalevskii TaxID=10224 RepID=A0ABM0GSW8_SACKO|nr:PREDICTED: UPF0317 protein C14orf159 homolog, mitochondrial-like [Saccoglossus kowalevskii]